MYFLIIVSIIVYHQILICELLKRQFLSIPVYHQIEYVAANFTSYIYTVYIILLTVSCQIGFVVVVLTWTLEMEYKVMSHDSIFTQFRTSKMLLLLNILQPEI